MNAAKLLADVLAPRVSDPAPISTTIRECVAVSDTARNVTKYLAHAFPSRSRGRTRSIKINSARTSCPR